MKDLPTLSEAQIEKLVVFTRSKYVKYEDVRLEIVDHLASDIEAQMAVDSKIDFDQALRIAYGKFPITGFNKFIEDKQAALMTYWKRRIFQVLKSYFTLPKIILTLLIFSLCVRFATTAESYLLVIATSLITFIVGFLFAYPLKKLAGNYLFLEVFRAKVSTYYLMGIICFVIPTWKNPFGDLSVIPNSLLMTSVFSVITTLNIILILAIVSGELKELLRQEINAKYQQFSHVLEV